MVLTAFASHITSEQIGTRIVSDMHLFCASIAFAVHAYQLQIQDSDSDLLTSVNEVDAYKRLFMCL
jgi:hypothetical protein